MFFPIPPLFLAFAAHHLLIMPHAFFSWPCEAISPSWVGFSGDPYRPASWVYLRYHRHLLVRYSVVCFHKRRDGRKQATQSSNRSLSSFCMEFSGSSVGAHLGKPRLFSGSTTWRVQDICSGNISRHQTQSFCEFCWGVASWKLEIGSVRSMKDG